MPVQARLPGTLPAPVRAKQHFADAHHRWVGARGQTLVFREAAQFARKRLDQANAERIEAGAAMLAAKADAEPVVFADLLATEKRAQAAEEVFKVAKGNLKQAAKAEALAFAERNRCLEDLAAVQRGER
jgi:hypothetical protein